MTKTEINELGPIEYEEAFNYSVSTYRIRSMTVSEKQKSGSGPTYTFDQPDDFDIDPNFVSNVGK